MKESKQFQDVVGEHQDAVVAAGHLRELQQRGGHDAAFVAGRARRAPGASGSGARAASWQAPGSVSSRPGGTPGTDRSRSRRRRRSRRRGPAGPPPEVRRLVAAQGEVQARRELRGVRAPRGRGGDGLPLRARARGSARRTTSPTVPAQDRALLGDDAARGRVRAGPGGGRDPLARPRGGRRAADAPRATRGAARPRSRPRLLRARSSSSSAAPSRTPPAPRRNGTPRRRCTSAG